MKNTMKKSFTDAETLAAINTIIQVQWQEFIAPGKQFAREVVQWCEATDEQRAKIMFPGRKRIPKRITGITGAGERPRLFVTDETKAIGLAKQILDGPRDAGHYSFLLYALGAYCSWYPIGSAGAAMKGSTFNKRQARDDFAEQRSRGIPREEIIQSLMKKYNRARKTIANALDGLLDGKRGPKPSR
jgi:hypothetical protein